MPTVPVPSRIDREWDSALVALSSPFIINRAAPFIDVDHHEIRVTSLRRAAAKWSTSERTMIDIAAGCWNGAGVVDIGNLCCTLDRGNLRRALAALAIRGGLLDTGTLTLDVAAVLA